MLTVPDEVKDLLHLDTCKKNIRIHFPNGERRDICNNLIVLNTVSFKESLCSQETLKFGLCEAPVFECEVVGVGNIKGVTIEVFCEIYCDQSVSGSVFRTDLQAFVYPIQYGVFIVDSCKRQADIQHRKIVAYGATATIDWGLSQSELMLSKFEKNSMFTFSQYPLEYMAVNTSMVNYDSALWDDAAGGISYKTRTKTIYDGDYTIVLDVAVFKEFYIFDSVAVLDVDTDNSKERKKEVEKIASILGLSNDTVIAILQYVNPRIMYFYNNNEIEVGCIAPKYPMVFNAPQNFDNNYTDASVVVLNSMQIMKIYGPNGYYNYIELNPDIYSSKTKRYSLKADYKTLPVTFTAIKKENLKYSLDFTDAMNIQDVLNYYSELYGVFGFWGRNNSFKMLNIKRQFGLTPGASVYPGETVYPQSVTGGKLLPEDYQSCWYDDEYTKPFGAVKCQYKNTNNEDCIFVYYLSGYDEDSDESSFLSYDLTNNEKIKNNLWSTTEISDFCQTIASNIEGVSYMPVDFKGRGIPYVEAGDTFEILTKSNDSITTIVLNRTLTGEQTLTDNYKSNGTGAAVTGSY